MLPSSFYGVTETAKLKYALATIDERIVVRLAIDSLKNDPHAFIVRAEDLYCKIVHHKGHVIQLIEFTYGIVRMTCAIACDASILIDFWFVEEVLAAAE